MDETKRITTAFQDKAAGAGSIEAIQCDLDNIEKAFTDCNEELAAMEMPDCGYCFQGEAILEMTENLRALFIYVGCAHPHVSEVLDFPLYTDFKSNATESLSHIVLDDIRTDNTFGMEEHVEVNDAGYLRVDSRVKEDLGFSDFFGITDIRPQDGYPVLENVETVGEFASLFRADYDRMKPEGMDINTFLEGYLTYGEYEHTGYHPVRDFLSGLADVTIIIPVIDAILGKDIITGETLNDFERGMKAAGATIDLFTLGQAMVLAGGVEAGAGIIVKTLAVEMVSNAAGYSAGYAANEMGMPLPVTWILSVATGCTVSATVGGYLFTSADGTITKCTAEEAGDLIKRLDKTDSPASFADMMSPEDAARYLRFLENGSTEGLTSAELEGIKKVDELLALKKISYQDVLDIRNSGKALESGTDAFKFNNWDDMKDAYKGTITQFVKENKPKYSPDIKKWFYNGGSIEIQNIDGKQIWTYTSSAGDSVPYIDGCIKFPDEYLNPTIKSVDIGEFTGDRGKDIDKMLSILEEDYGITEIPEGYIVHHDIENGILQLVDENIHTEFTHIGGHSIYK